MKTSVFLFMAAFVLTVMSGCNDLDEVLERGEFIENSQREGDDDPPDNGGGRYGVVVLTPDLTGMEK